MCDLTFPRAVFRMQPLAYFAVRRPFWCFLDAPHSCESAGMAAMGGEGEPRLCEQRALVSRGLKDVACDECYTFRWLLERPIVGRWARNMM